VVEITYQLGDQTFGNPDAFMTTYLKAQAGKRVKQFFVVNGDWRWPHQAGQA
jgi:hypothetical protein